MELLTQACRRDWIGDGVPASSSSWHRESCSVVGRLQPRPSRVDCRTGTPTSKCRTLVVRELTPDSAEILPPRQFFQLCQTLIPKPARVRTLTGNGDLNGKSPSRETGSRHWTMPELRLTEVSLGGRAFGPSCEDLLNCHDDVIEQDSHERQGDEHGEHQWIIGADLAAVE